jgi:hypothetical protein
MISILFNHGKVPAKSAGMITKYFARNVNRNRCVVRSSVPWLLPDTRDFAQRWSYSSWRRHQMPPVSSLRPLGARSSHWYMPQRPSNPRA